MQQRNAGRPQNQAPYDGLTSNVNLGYVFQKLMYRKYDGTSDELCESDTPSSQFLGWLTEKTPKKDTVEPLCIPYGQVASSCGISSFQMRLQYPGAYAGLGYTHGIKGKVDDIETGFSFDYTTGLPYIPGSSLKGTLRSHFIGTEEADETIALISESNECKDILPADMDKEKKRNLLLQLETCLFGHRIVSEHKTIQGQSGCVVFFDVFPVIDNNGNGKLMANDSITPHDPEGNSLTKPGVPLRTIKLAPGTNLLFHCFVPETINPYPEHAEHSVSETQVISLFKLLLRCWGIGAKTNSGYGSLLDV